MWKVERSVKVNISKINSLSPVLVFTRQARKCLELTFFSKKS